MTQFKGFETREAAEEFIRKNHGFLTFDERTPKRKLLTERGREYWMAVEFGGLDSKKYPYCVQWNI